MNIEDSLQNWYLYLKSLPEGGPHIDTTCRSIEHKYLPEAGEVFDEEKKETEFFDGREAERVEELVCQLPEKLKKIIVYRYVKCRQLSKSQLASKLKQGKYEFEQNLFLAKSIIQRGLDDRRSKI
jgi:DNA-directed RNA polymerase specialized sigma24 family protein